MTSAQAQVERYYAQLDGGVESMLIDYSHGVTLAEYSAYGAPVSTEDVEASQLFCRGVSNAINSYLQAARRAGVAGNFEEIILTVDDMYTFVCPLESEPSVLLSGTLSAESSSLGMLRHRTRSAAKDMSIPTI